MISIEIFLFHIACLLAETGLRINRSVPVLARRYRKRNSAHVHPVARRAGRDRFKPSGQTTRKLLPVTVYSGCGRLSAIMKTN